ncbi:enoyl-CoA hydratase [Nocardia rhizosphaerihabitans]|uniref:Enoyl-CoA hydratase n=1 Tax=Nocardia rhizosphaerihabitans TaxID=1691570 RepID=A0ABQ2L1P1_9NOCA|nr:enoyl-CoA hydratase [Nocardia rhizosphaerihabitans]
MDENNIFNDSDCELKGRIRPVIRVVDALAEPDFDATATPPGVVIAVADDPAAAGGAYWLDHATLTLTTKPSLDPRVVTVPSVSDALDRIDRQCTDRPLAAAVCDDVLRAGRPGAGFDQGLLIESLAYSTLQGGPEFAAWLRERATKSSAPQSGEPLVIRRDGQTLHIGFDRPHRHNAFDDRTRAALLDALAVARWDESICAVELTGSGPTFCSGGDLAEFGTFTDVASAHLARTRYSPARALHALAQRLGPNLRARIHGRTTGSGLEMAAFCGTVSAHPDTVVGLPELRLGLIPGAGGTVSVPRRIGRWRTAYMVLSGSVIDAPTALDWGLVDEIIDPGSATPPSAARSSATQ